MAFAVACTSHWKCVRALS